jgi:hypothetical protein
MWKILNKITCNEILKTICIWGFFVVVIYFMFTNPNLKTLYTKSFSNANLGDIFWVIFFGTFFGNIFR